MPAAWDNGIAPRFMPKRYTSRELVKLAGDFGWMLVGVRGPSQLQAPRKPVHSHHRASPKRRTSGASGGYGEENQTGAQVMRFLIMLEQTETGFAVQAPDLAIATYGANIEAAKRAAGEAIRSP